MKKWNFGIIGSGLIAGFHAKAIQSLENAALVGICGTNAVKTQELASTLQCKAFLDYDDEKR